MLLHAEGGKYFSVWWFPIFEGQKLRGYMLKYADDTAYQIAVKDLSEKNQILCHLNDLMQEDIRVKKELAIYRIRNHIGREVHDVLGHSIVIVLSILEVVKILLKNNTDVSEKILQAASVIRDAKEQMSHSYSLSAELNQEHPPEGNNEYNAGQETGLVRKIREIAKNAESSGHEIQLTLQGKLIELPARISEVVIRMCQEAITNAVKHGKAEKIDIILRLAEARLEVYIFDNGKGCAQIVKGYGLSGMETRITEELGGILDYGPIEGGFIVRATLPYE
ncbi:hypothetical protein MASR2M70_20430 [Bacillota bacterium]